LCSRAIRARPERARVVGASFVIVGIPLLVLALGRLRSSGSASSGYAGTTVRLDGEAAETWLLGVVGSLPGAAWPKAVDVLGVVGLVPVAFVVVAALGYVVWRYRRAAVVQDPTETMGTLVDSDRSAHVAAIDTPMAVMFALCLVVYWLVAVAVHAVTIKVQDETLGLGYVYTSYATGAAVVALGIAVAGRRMLQRSRLGSTALFVAVAVSIGTVAIQQTVNWRLSDRLRSEYASNDLLLDQFDGNAPQERRCDGLARWAAARPWPEYYETDIINGLQVSFDHYFGEPFCTGYPSPP
jgi:hypothetical protein